MLKNFTRQDLLFIAALACFLIALLIALPWIIHGGNYEAWATGGFVALTLAIWNPEKTA